MDHNALCSGTCGPIVAFLCVSQASEDAMAKTVAAVIMETLQAAGASRCYGIPGDTLNHVTDAIRQIR